MITEITNENVKLENLTEKCVTLGTSDFKDVFA